MANENTITTSRLLSSVWRLYYNLPYRLKVPVNLYVFIRDRRKMLRKLISTALRLSRVIVLFFSAYKQISSPFF